ncbi:MAG TPA: alpha/beta fold hydrolase [Arenibaculum sp.]|nr:alpha/beta fold hydrolase [Arenibaculum sp.]
MSQDAIRFRRVELASGIGLHIAEAGRPDAPLVILLHGFPEFWFAWRRQIEPLADAGFRVVAPDQRGYNLSDKPEGIGAYVLDRIADDVTGLADALGYRTFSVVGHDWGGIVGWWLAMRAPERLERLAILNAPHPATLSGYLAGHPRQLARSWYVLFFQLPRLPERLIRARGFRLAMRALTGTSRRGTFSSADLARYCEAWARPGAMTAMINWYRALRRRPLAGPARIGVPTLVLWGRRDAFLEPGLADAALRYCDRGRLVRFDDAGHWIQHERPARVNELLAGFLREGRPAGHPGEDVPPALRPAGIPGT